MPCFYGEPYGIGFELGPNVRRDIQRGLRNKRGKIIKKHEKRPRKSR